MACSNKASLCRFVECIEDLENWIEFGRQDCSDLGQLSKYLEKWIALNRVPDSLKGESIVYKRVAEGLEQLHWQIEAGSDRLSMKIVEQSLLFAAQGTEYSCGNLFVNGVTFMKFAPNRILPVKHLFFIGADAASFPGSRQRNTLDLRKSCYPWPGDDSPVARNRYGFLSLLMRKTVVYMTIQRRGYISRVRAVYWILEPLTYIMTTYWLKALKWKTMMFHLR